MKWKWQLSTSHIPHSMYMVFYMYWCNIPSMSVTVPVCFTLSSWFPEIDIKTEHNFKSTLILTNIRLKMFLDVCLGMHAKIQTLKIISETMFLNFVFHLLLQPKTIIRGAILMDISSWKNSLQAYGIRIWKIWKERYGHFVYWKWKRKYGQINIVLKI